MNKLGCELAGSDDVAKELMDAMARAKAEVNVMVGTLRERVSALKDKVERLGRQVRVMRMTYWLRTSCRAAAIHHR